MLQETHRMPSAVWDKRSASYRGLSGDATVDSSQLVPFGPEVDEAIRAHAVREYPKECCGIVVKNGKTFRYLPMENICKEPEKGFEMDLQIFATSEVVGIAHSHSVIEPYPSKIDMEQQMLWDVPWAIATVTCDGKNDPYCMDLFWFGDSLPILPLLNRAFRPGVQDCFSLSRDHYRLQGIDLPNFPRDHAWWRGKERIDIFGMYLDQSGFEKISINDLQVNDGLAVPYGTEMVCHCGVLLEGNKFLHHLGGKLSVIEDVTRWIQRAKEGGRFFRVKK